MGMMKMMRKEKYQAVRTAKVTANGCRNTSEYLHNISVSLKDGFACSYEHSKENHGDRFA